MPSVVGVTRFFEDLRLSVVVDLAHPTRPYAVMLRGREVNRYADRNRANEFADLLAEAVAADV